MPNLVNTVKGYASHEREVLTAVTEARARVGSIQVTPETLNDPKAFAQFQVAQQQLSGTLSRLLAVSGELSAVEGRRGLQDLQSQLEGTENRITVARNRYIQSVQAYNVTVRSLPSNLTAMAFGYKEKPNFTVASDRRLPNQLS